MKQRFFSSTAGKARTRAMPSGMVNGVRPLPSSTGSACSGGTPQNSS